ncbi:hypothetical protein [Brevundimonas sp.]|uniref:hypothetical protein n=1 Tax=Brevundimonas sp. TaxID=1871086 RepID=UPI0035B36DE5
MTPKPRHKAIGWQLLATGSLFFGLALVLGVGVGGVQVFSQPMLILVVFSAITGWAAMQLWRRGRYGLAWPIVVGAGLAVLVGLIALIYASAASFANGPDWYGEL